MDTVGFICPKGVIVYNGHQCTVCGSAKLNTCRRSFQALSGFIEELRDFLDDQADAEYFTDSGMPQPNKAMSLLVELNEIWPEEK